MAETEGTDASGDASQGEARGCVTLILPCARAAFGWGSRGAGRLEALRVKRRAHPLGNGARGRGAGIYRTGGRSKAVEGAIAAAFPRCAVRGTQDGIVRAGGQEQHQYEQYGAASCEDRGSGKAIHGACKRMSLPYLDHF